MQKVLTAAQMREVDRLTTERYGIPSIILMENAAHAVARVITEKLGGSVQGKSILILCGKGNNGGDGAALARILSEQGGDVWAVLLGKVADAKGDARTNFDLIQRKLEEPANFDNHASPELGRIRFLEQTDGEYLRKRFRTDRPPDVVVDALVGTGFSGILHDNIAQVIRTPQWFEEKADRENEFLLVSVDIPTGLNSDRPELPDGDHVMADFTVTFTAPKAANVAPPASSANGEVIVANIGTPSLLINEVNSQLFVTESYDIKAWLHQTAFDNDSYKNKRGHALLIAGSPDYSGAAVLAGNAAMRSGVGLVTLACPENAKTEIASRLLPEVILSTIESPDFDEHVSKADAIAVGCGLDANDAGVEKLVREVVENRSVPVIVDAGALWFYSPFETPLQKPARSKGTRQPDSSPLILTPHEGEFLRLLGTEDKDAIKDRVAAVRDFAVKHKVILVLKGERVLIGEPGGKVVVNPTGNSGLGKAGNGDTLTGILAGFVAQAVKMEIDVFETVVAAVYVAGMAGDVAEKKYGKRVMTASDVRECLVDVFESLEAAK